jgi:hypothetical protein
LADEEFLEWFNVALASKTPHAARGLPATWAAPDRKQLERPSTCITWDVPKAELGRYLEDISYRLRSPPVYMSGTGVQLLLVCRNDGDTGSKEFLLGVVLCSYSPPGLAWELCDVASGLTCDVRITRDATGNNSPQEVDSFVNTLSSRRGFVGRAVTAATPADLEPYLVDGCLKLRATIKVL